MTASILDTAPVHVTQLDAEALSRLRARLESERVSQEVLVAEQAKALTELDGHGDANGLRERELANAASSRAAEVIDDIDDALARMAAHTYGTCRSCRGPIPVERLEAIPHVRLCVACSGRGSRFLG
jgi:RNA polymerase-binding transcription factor DksA